MRQKPWKPRCRRWRNRCWQHDHRSLFNALRYQRWLRFDFKLTPEQIKPPILRTSRLAEAVEIPVARYGATWLT
ncbi:hypothetical protein KCP75_26080 [Salmonella enterica subsp. enterica]|nr:hypothetical protein KCP75_26080 [Salmonella enterica subsp. enterica]